MLDPDVSTSQSQNRDEGKVDFDLPDEIAIEILSRIPAIDVVRLRSVCKRWRDLTCSQSFMLLHLRHCLPMVLFYAYCFDDSEWGLIGYDHYLLDRWWEPVETTPKIYQFGKVSDFNLTFSNDGLVIMGCGRDYMITNPLYHEKVHITLSEEFQTSQIYGVFFHPSLKEYCTLWKLTLSEDFSEYRILNLGSKPCWRDVNNPWSHINRIWRILPVLMDEHLYWVVEPEAGYILGRSFPADIMEFDIRKEEFTFISSPVPEPYRCSEYNINLLDIGGLLSLVQTSPGFPASNQPFEVNMWRLKDRTRQLWTMSSYNINTDPFWGYRKPMALVNDELVIQDTRQLYTCNLKLGTLRKFEDVRDDASLFTTHVMTLFSLRNCKSEIFMDKRGEVEKNKKRRRGDISGGVDENPVMISE